MGDSKGEKEAVSPIVSTMAVQKKERKTGKKRGRRATVSAPKPTEGEKDEMSRSFTSGAFSW